MNGPALNQMMFAELQKERAAHRTRANTAVQEAKATGEAMIAWLRQVLPECCDERGVPHVRFVGALSILRMIHGKGNVRRDMVKQRVRAKYPDAYAEVYGPDALNEGRAS